MNVDCMNDYNNGSGNTEGVELLVFAPIIRFLGDSYTIEPNSEIGMKMCETC